MSESSSSTEDGLALDQPTREQQGVDGATKQSTTREAQTVAWLSAADLSRLFLQALHFFVLAGLLGATGFGQFAGTAALIGVVQPLASWGASDLLLKHVARNRTDLLPWLGTAVLVTSATTLALSILLVVAIGPLGLGHAFDLRLLLPLLVTELVTLRVVEIFWAAFLAVDRIGGAEMARLGWALWRFTTLIAYALIVSTASATGWATFQAASLAVLCVGYVVYLRAQLGAFEYRNAFRRMSFSEGFAFAMGSTSETIYGDADKALLVRDRGATVAGEYTAAYRLMSFAFVPVSALVVSKLTSMYRSGETGVGSSLAVLRRFRLPVVGYGLLVAAGMVFLGPLARKLLGDDFEEMPTIIAWLCLMPLVQASHRILGAVLMTGGKVRSRGIALAGTAGLNIVLSFVLISRYSWRGAVAASYLSEVLLLVVFAILIVAAGKREARDLVTSDGR